MWYLRVAASIYVGYIAFDMVGWWAAPLAFLVSMGVTFPLQMVWGAILNALNPDRELRDAMQTLGIDEKEMPKRPQAASPVAMDDTEDMALVRRMLDDSVPESEIHAALQDRMSPEDATALIETMKSARAVETRPDFLVPRDVATAFADHMEAHGIDDGLHKMLVDAGCHSERAAAFLAAFSVSLQVPAGQFPPQLKPTEGTPRQRASLLALMETLRQSLEAGFDLDEQALRISYGTGVDIADVRHLIRTAL